MKNTLIGDQILQTLKTCFPMEERLSLHEPNFKGHEWDYVKECIDTGWVSSVGKYVDVFEKKLAEFTGVQYAVATGTGTSALHMCYLLAGVVSGDEVLVPTLTFVGTINPIHYCGAIPHFIDSEEISLGVDAVKLESYLQDMSLQIDGVCVNRLTGRTIRALCVVHTLGHPVDLDPLVLLCNKYHIQLIEDAAEALGSYYKGAHVGGHGLLSAFSFNGNKIITTGGGGAILTNNEALAKRAKHLTTTAKLAHPWLFEHDEMGYNYRLPNINAALGCAQLEQLPTFLERKRLLAWQYEQRFQNVAEVSFIHEPSYAQSNCWLNAILLNASVENAREDVLELLNSEGFMSRPLWNLQHTLPMYQCCPRMPLLTAESLQRRLIKIPSSAHLSIKETQ